MEILRKLGATLLRDRYPISMIDSDSIKDAVSSGVYKIVSQNDEFFEVETVRQESQFYGRGLDSTGYPSNLAAKIIAFPGIQQSKLNASDRVIFPLRSPSDTCRSQQERGLLRQHRTNYLRFVWHFEELAKSAPCPILYWDTDEAVLSPVESVGRLAAFCGLAGDVNDAASIIKPDMVKPSVQPQDDAAEAIYRVVRAKCR
jgi:hypothetical protein